ncbi:UbiH/UbiF/VisC/COQ6 family ubiquinone biosynthesis hydroxylase [Pigmentiphaga soli]|uniref:UbiH/UbiF/VisC/COQ6 family ubiquinone biosynthesis hydroxylase n=1 Tax=Pigmentiphaga soli TaxID=1007095 RepID=UPI0031E8D166
MPAQSGVAGGPPPAAAADLTIIGGGPVGMALALLLARDAREPGRIVLCAAERAAGAAAADPRVLALNHGSRVLLQALGAWPAGGADILDIHVSQRGRLGRTHISHSDFGVPALGTVVRYGALADALAQAVARSGVAVRHGTARIAAQEESVVLVEQDGAGWPTAVCVQAEGGAFGEQARGDVHRRYGQHAVLGSVLAARPRAGWAWERFTREGPLALLPYPAAPGAAPDPRRHALVWCCAPDRAQALCALDDAAFAHELNHAFGERLGRLAPAGPRHASPLGMNLRREPVHGRAVAIGNAAQTLHPVAGQGLNLGLRDAARLAQTLAPWLNATAGDPRPALARYAAARRADRWLTAGLTDFLPRVFASGLPPVEHAAGLALLALDASAALRRPLARHLLQGLRA